MAEEEEKNEEDAVEEIGLGRNFYRIYLLTYKNLKNYLSKANQESVKVIRFRYFAFSFKTFLT